MDTDWRDTIDGSARPPPLRARLLGEVQLAVGDRTLEPASWPRRSARSLLLLLLVTPGHRIGREHAVELLWPAAPAATAGATWYQAVSTLRRVLEPGLPPRAPSGYLAVDATSVALRDHAGTWIDVDAFMAGRIREATATPAHRRDRLRSSVTLYRGDLLAHEPDVGWATARREELRVAWQHDVLELAGLDRVAGEPLASVTQLQTIVANDETAEAVQAELIRAFAAAGQRGRALRQLERCRRALADELGVEPSAELLELEQSIRRGDLDHAAPLAARGAGTSILVLPPLPATALVGRDREIEMVEDMVWRPDVRLVTVTGPGGIGKTRLVTEVAHHLSYGVDGDIVFVPFADVAAPEFVLPAVCEAFGVPVSPRRSGAELLRRQLGKRDVLLVLDNFEHVLDAAVEIASVVEACPRLTVVATSRVPLRISGEHVVELPPLAAPDPRRTSLAMVSRSPAVALFAQRARATAADFALTEQNAAAVARLCDRLDGLPLAIELAAARVRTLTPAAMLARLDRRLDLLTGGPRDAPPRLRSLREAIAWSHDLLSPASQRQFRLLGVFSGGFDLEGAAVVAGIADHEPRGPHAPAGDAPSRAAPGSSVLDDIATLVDHCLVRADEQADGVPRFRMLETIRAYALERLAAIGEEAEARRRHAMWCIALAEDGKPRYVGQRSRAWLERMALERDNLRAALTWLIAQEDASRSLRLATALWWYWRSHSSLTEGRDWIDRALRIAAPAAPAERAWALLLAGDLAWVQQDGAIANRLLDESEALWRELGNARGLALSALARGFAVMTSGDEAAAVEWFERAISGLIEPADGVLVISAMTNLGAIAYRRGDRAAGDALLEEALATGRATGLAWAAAEAMEHIGHLARADGDLARAAECYRDSLRSFVAEGDRWSIGGQLVNLAVLATMVERWTVAARLFGAGASIYEELKLRSFMFASFHQEYVAAVDAVRQALGDQRTDELWHVGRSCDLEDVIAEAESLALAIAASPGAGSVSEPPAIVPLDAARRQSRTSRR